VKRNIQLVLFFAVTLLLLIISLRWLATGVLLFCGLYVVFTLKPKSVFWFKKHTILSAAFTLTGVFLLAVGVRVFMIEIYSIPSGSMENTLVQGDKVLVSKLNYGPKLPRSPFDVPWLNVFFLLRKNAYAKADSVHWEYRRLSGFSSVRRNDVVVFQFPGNEKEVFIKRCVALPGDTFQIIRSELFINSEKQAKPTHSKTGYKAWINDTREFRHFADSLNIPVYGAWFTGRNDFIKLNLTNKQKGLLANLACVDSITTDIADPDSLNRLFPRHQEFSWSTDQYGPLIIPAKGMTIEVNEINMILYGEILHMYEGFKAEEENGKFLFDNREVKEYTFRQDYYFMMGDNRHQSNDSRSWGFVPEENVIGKAVLVLFSRDYEGWKWERFLKGL